MLERADNSGTRGSERAAGCQNPALVASLLKKGSKTSKKNYFVFIVLQLKNVKSRNGEIRDFFIAHNITSTKTAYKSNLF